MALYPELDQWKPLPGERTVGFAANPNGPGGWYATNYGGVLAVGGAPFGDQGGSYLGLPAEGRQGGTRYFDRVEATGDTYTVYSTSGEPYTFRVPVPPKAAATPVDRSEEKAHLDALFAGMGLQGLGDWAFDLLKRDTPIESIKLQLRDREEYKARFPAMAELAKRGRAMNEAQYIEYEKSAAALLQESGIGLFDDQAAFRDMVAKNLVGDVSLREMARRIDDGYLKIIEAPEEVQAFFTAAYGPKGAAAMATYFLDPEHALPTLERQLGVAGVGGEARRFGFDINTGLAERLHQSLGLDGAASRQLFAQASQHLPRLNELVQRFNDDDDPLTLEDYADAVVLQSPAQMEQITRLLSRRRAEFSPVDGGERGRGGALVGLRQR